MMSETNLVCDQAIFTSIRTPLGEGYRIIAASRHLRPDEKQAITRSSPSHDALCPPTDNTPGTFTNVLGAAFYSLPRGRLCVALSCYAGAEHTGRGGQRVYTHNLVFDKNDFPRCQYNPFAVLRAMVDAGLSSPQLKPPPVLPELELPITKPAGEVSPVALNAALDPAWRSYVLNALLVDRSLIVDVVDGWLEIAEALLMGVPGPMRAEISFGTGMRFSIGRCHRLLLLHDDPNVTRSRIAGRPVEYVDPALGQEPETPMSAWLSFVERHWTSGDVATLSRRTSRAFVNTDGTVRERVGRIYNDTDAIPETDTAKLLEVARDYLNGPKAEWEKDLVDELLNTTQCALLGRLNRMPWMEASRHWHAICALWRQSKECHNFAHPLAEQALTSAKAEHPTVAATAALELVSKVSAVVQEEHNTLVHNVLARLADWADRATDAQIEGLSDLCLRWRAARPQCPFVERIHQRCTAPATR